MNDKDFRNSRRRFLHNTALMTMGLPLIKFNKFTDAGRKPPLVHENVPTAILKDPNVSLKFGKERMVLDQGLQPSMLCTHSNTLVVQGQLPKKPYPQKRIFYPSALETVTSRDGGNTWEEFPLKQGDNGVNIEGAVCQLKNGKILALETYVTPGKYPDQGIGLLYTSTDDYKTLQGPTNMVFHIPGVDFYGSTDDGGRPHSAIRLHRRVIELPNGDLLTTMYGWLKGDDTPSGYMPTMKKTRVMLLRSKNQGKFWDMISTVAVDPYIGTEGFDEPVLTRISQGPHAGRLLCFMRTGRELYETFSDDGGFIWAPPRPRVFADLDVYRTDLWEEMFKDVKRNDLPIIGNPVEMIGAVVDPDLIELRSGILAAVFGVRIPAKACWNNPGFPWNGNYVAFSLDHGITWSHVVRLTSAVATTHYMAIEETQQDNTVFITYDYGYWGYAGGRYVYGRPVSISLKK